MKPIGQKSFNRKSKQTHRKSKNRHWCNWEIANKLVDRFRNWLYSEDEINDLTK